MYETPFPALMARCVDLVPFSTITVDAFIDSINSMIGIEGFVIELCNGQMIKIKTQWYLDRHILINEMWNVKRVIAACFGELLDDMKSRFAHAQEVVDYLTVIEERSAHHYNHMFAQTEKFYDENKELEAKPYALKAKALDDDLFHMYMYKFRGKSDKLDKMIRNKIMDNYEHYVGEFDGYVEITN